jgi:hypothetical protein
LEHLLSKARQFSSNLARPFAAFQKLPLRAAHTFTGRLDRGFLVCASLLQFPRSATGQINDLLLAGERHFPQSLQPSRFSGGQPTVLLLEFKAIAFVSEFFELLGLLLELLASGF